MHRISKRQPAWIANLTVLLLAAFSSALAEMPAQTQSGRLLWQMQQGYTTATLLNTEVDLQISGLLARVSVRQEFHNDGPDWVEGLYVFPLPDGAAVDVLSLSTYSAVALGPTSATKLRVPGSLERIKGKLQP